MRMKARGDFSLPCCTSDSKLNFRGVRTFQSGLNCCSAPLIGVSRGHEPGDERKAGGYEGGMREAEVCIDTRRRR
nr:hypothetical protein CFP56_00991 [Quercus suber]